MAATSTRTPAKKAPAKRAAPAAKPAAGDRDEPQGKLIKLNLNLSGYGARDDIIELPEDEADELIEMGHADPVVEGDEPKAPAEVETDADPVVDPLAGLTDDERAERRAAEARAAAGEGVHLAEQKK